ncbi:Hypothetical protein NTJ_02161 [Nesidiocoris tenuis]|uniref:Uncharacterized protein n=1 Tax=Nesidiocoris tenuis TaxID=355587 RepID=A0ABN7ADW2_9HEMI|nr:Hypothetical protein NTJ_02161 [Nesidiocoris tenuis]
MRPSRSGGAGGSTFCKTPPPSETRNVRLGRRLRTCKVCNGACCILPSPGLSCTEIRLFFSRRLLPLVIHHCGPATMPLELRHRRFTGPDHLFSFNRFLMNEPSIANILTASSITKFT